MIHCKLLRFLVQSNQGGSAQLHYESFPMCSEDEKKPGKYSSTVITEDRCFHRLAHYLLVFCSVRKVRFCIPAVRRLCKLTLAGSSFVRCNTRAAREEISTVLASFDNVLLHAFAEALSQVLEMPSNLVLLFKFLTHCTRSKDNYERGHHRRNLSELFHPDRH